MGDAYEVMAAMDNKNYPKPELKDNLTESEIHALTSLAMLPNLHAAVVEFSIGDSAANELGSERIVADHVPLEEANAFGSYIVGSAEPKTVTTNFWDDRTDHVELDKRDGKHRILLDLDCPHLYVQSSTPGHGHLVIDVPQDWSNLKQLLQLLGDMGVLQYGYVDATFNRGETWLRTPGTKKTIATLGIADPHAS